LLSSQAINGFKDCHGQDGNIAVVEGCPLRTAQVWDDPAIEDGFIHPKGETAALFKFFILGDSFRITKRCHEPEVGVILQLLGNSLGLK
jgi:hypothetical protein